MKIINKFYLTILYLSFYSSIYAVNLQAYIDDLGGSMTLSDIHATTSAVSIPAAYASCGSVPPNTVTGVSFTSGLAYKDGTLYGLEWDGGTGPDIYLYAYSPGPCAVGTRVGVMPIGEINLESLAYCESNHMFYSVNFDFGTHFGELVVIDPETGQGGSIGVLMDENVRVTGMVCDDDVLWAVTSGFGGPPPMGRDPELIAIDPNSGMFGVVGLLMLPALEVESIAIDPAFPGRLYAAGKALYVVDKTSGLATQVESETYDEVWGMAATDVIFANRFELF